MHGPGGLAVADSEDEVAQHVGADQGVGHLGMELYRNKGLLFMAQGGVGRVVAVCSDDKAGCNLFNTVAMAHPDLVTTGRGFHTGKQTGGIGYIELSLTEFPFFGLLHPAAKLLYHELGTVADTEYRNAQFKNTGI